MKRDCAVVLPFLGLALLCLSAQAAASELPDWVTQAVGTQVQVPKGAHPKAAVLLEDKLLTVNPDGQISERYREVIKILRPQGRAYAHPYAWFNKDHKLISFQVWSIGPDGHHYAVKKDQIYERGSQDWGILYDDVRVRSANVPGSDPGGIVAYEYIMQYPLYSGDAPWEFQNPIPTARSVFEIDLPPGWQHRALWRKYSSVQPTEVRPNCFRWELTNIPGIDLDSVPLAPAEEVLAGRMEAYFSASPLPQGSQEAPQLWSRIGEWYTRLAAPASEGPSDIAGASHALANANDDFTDRIQKIADYMQQKIRYVGIEIGIGGYIPHSAEEIYRNQYGDCKDKATLLIAMLDAVGVRATWVMVDTARGVIDPAVPSLIGNHMIAAIEIPKGYQNQELKAVVTAKTGKRYLIFDPTNQFVPIGLLPTYLQGSTGLLMAGPDSEAITLPVLNPGSDTLDRTASLTLTADGSLTGSATIRHLGASSGDLRYSLAMSNDTEMKQNLENALRSDFSSFVVSSEDVKNVRNLNQPLILSYDVTVSSYAKHAGDMLLVRPRIIGSDGIALDDTARKYPIEFACTRDWRDSFNVKLPAGYKVDDLPDPVTVDAGFASYRSDVKASDGVLHYSRELIMKKLEIGAGEYSALRKFENEIYTDENRDAVLTRTN